MNYDHHCIWINNCVGQKSYYYFSMFLIALIFNCTYKLYYLVQIPEKNNSTKDKSKELSNHSIEKWINKSGLIFIVLKYILIVILVTATIASL